MEYSEFIGNREQIDFIRGLFRKSEFPQTVIIEGQSGVGKLTLSKMIAAAVVCGSIRDGEPCGECEACKKAADDAHADINVIQAENSIIPIEEMRGFIEHINWTSNEGGKKVYIIKNAETLRADSQNLLLKTLEEPPAGVHFILTSSDINMILDTVKSRSVILSLKELTTVQMAEYLKKNGYNINDPKIKRTVKLANGSVGRLLNIINNEVYLVKYAELLRAFIELLKTGDKVPVIKIINKEDLKRDDAKAVYSYFEMIVRDIAVTIALGENGDGNLLYFSSTDDLIDLTDAVSMKKLIRIFRGINKYKSQIYFNANERLNLYNFFMSV